MGGVEFQSFSPIGSPFRDQREGAWCLGTSEESISKSGNQLFDLWIFDTFLNKCIKIKHVSRETKDKLKEQITKFYRLEQQTISFLNQTRLFRVTLKKRLKCMLHMNKAWLLVIGST